MLKYQKVDCKQLRLGKYEILYFSKKCQDSILLLKWLSLIKSKINVEVAMSSDREKPQILVFEDNPENQDILKRRLSKRGYEVHIAVSGDEGLAMLQSIGHTIDIILMDIQMPGPSGIEVTKMLKKNDQFKHIPVVAVSANIDYRKKEALEEVGFHDTFLKPIDFNRLFRSLSSILSSLSNKAG